MVLDDAFANGKAKPGAAGFAVRGKGLEQPLGHLRGNAFSAILDFGHDLRMLSRQKRLGFFVNHDLAGYEVPVHADIPHQEVIFLDEADPISSPMKAKGVGELGICGAGAAVINAIHNATGARIRDFPATPDKLLPALEALDD